jgi:hypothetical protein
MDLSREVNLHEARRRNVRLDDALVLKKLTTVLLSSGIPDRSNPVRFRFCWPITELFIDKCNIKTVMDDTFKDLQLDFIDFSENRDINITQLDKLSSDSKRYPYSMNVLILLILLYPTSR